MDNTIKTITVQVDLEDYELLYRLKEESGATIRYLVCRGIKLVINEARRAGRI